MSDFAINILKTYRRGNYVYHQFIVLSLKINFYLKLVATPPEASHTNSDLGKEGNGVRVTLILMLKEKNIKIFGERVFFSETTSLERLEAPSPKIVINFSRTYEKLLC